MTKHLYRVTIKTTASLRPRGEDTYWNHEVAYCGYDLDEARRIYHAREPEDSSAGYGNECRATVFERLDAAGLDGNEAGVMAKVDPRDVS